MNIFITGGTGLIGKALVEELVKQGHTLTVLTRQALPAQQAVQFCQNFANLPDFNGFDAVINLAGEPIFDRRWSAKQKQILTASRVDLTRQIVEKIRHSTQPPHTFISGSATGFYGDVSLENIKNETEQIPCGTGFASQLCQAWEAEALRAESPQTRVCLVRTGIVLSPNGGALQRMLPLYRLGLGGKLGSGAQHWGWIALDDHIQALRFLLNHNECRGAFNFVAPTQTTQAEFNQTLAECVHRPAFCHTPAWLLKLILGERAKLLLDNQPLMPHKLLAHGYKFQFASLKAALQAV